ncbi:hypothetical protein ACKI1Z_41140, partial [Streptomyces galilaeus]|uniref:hypothetical protein n=1 Tax=Streptomyces galilaeus TaxID=33899 RepID=UPI0038F79CFB
SSIEKWPDGNTILDTTIVTEQIRLLKGFDADPDSLAGQQYQNLGLVSHLDTHTALSCANSNSLYNPASATGYVRVATTGNIALNFNTTIVDGVP